MNLIPKKSNVFFFLACTTLVLITSAVLALCHRLWWYFPLGALLGIMTHILMLLQNRRFYRIQNSEIEKVVYSPKKDSILWYVLRLILMAGYLTLIIILSGFCRQERMLEVVILLISGYMTIKVIFIVFLIIYKEGR